MTRVARGDNTGVISGAPGLVGTVPEVVPIGGFRPNPWNPTGITAEERDRIRHGFETDGWLVAQALLVWRTDERGATRNLIVDGEQRWRVATELGMARGPVSFLDGPSEAAARALTIKMNARRSGGGGFDMSRLARNLGAIEVDLSSPEMAHDLGLSGAIFERVAQMNDPPPEFREFDEGNVRTEHTCPRCKFKW